MDLSALSSSQLGTQQRRILVNAQGSPLKINLQAVELEGRPKLVRTLKTSGALVVSNAKEAVIILVSSTTESGKRLIRTWGHDASKVVLEYTWVRACIDVGRPLLEDDNWGGAMTIDDGQPVTIDGVVVDEDELEEVEALVTKSPLPTPRVTPVDPTSQRPESNTERSDIQSNSSMPYITGIPPQTPAIVQSAAAGVSLSNESMPESRVDMPVAPPASQPLPHPQPTLFVQPSQSQSYTYPPFAIQQPYSSPPMVPTEPFPHTGPPAQQHQPQITQAPNLPHAPLHSIQPQMQMSPNIASTNGVNMQAPNFATIMTIMEVVRHMDQSRLGQNQLSISQPSVHSNTPVFATQSNVSGSAPSASTSSDMTLATPFEKRTHGSVDDASEDRFVTRKPRIIPSCHSSKEVLTPSKGRKRLPAGKPTNPPSKRLRKGKERETSVDSTENSEACEVAEASDDSYSTQLSTSPPARPRNIVARKKSGEIFLSETREPLGFFVQVDLHGRHTVVTNVKKNKGKIVNNIADADYSILFPRSDTFQGLLNEATALNKTPILAAFVADCIEEGALLDEKDYVVESVTKVKNLKRGRQSALSFKMESAEIVQHRAKVAKTKSPPDSHETKTPLADRKSKKSPKFKSDVGNRDDLTPRSPTPPALATRQLMKNGKYLFTEAEDEYVMRFARHRLTCDPNTSNTALVYKLHKKMPHHTAASWAAHIDKKLKGALEDVRKRANIAKRKRESEATNRDLPPAQVGENKSSRRRTSSTGKGDIPPHSSQSSQEELERQDFHTITHFFASGGGGDDDDDERVWQALERHQQCRSASSWPDYYAAHQVEVYARIEELTEERT